MGDFIKSLDSNLKSESKHQNILPSESVQRSQNPNNYPSKTCTNPNISNERPSAFKTTTFDPSKRALPNKPQPKPKADLVPGESILEIFVRSGLATPTGWDTYWMGNAEQLDPNSTPACLGHPSTKLGYYDIGESAMRVVCPFCGQRFTNVDLEGKHRWGRCQKLGEKGGLKDTEKAKGI